MRAAYFYGKGIVKIEEVERPKIGPSDALVKVGYCGLCGSDRHKFYDGWPFPLISETKPKPEELGKKKLKYIPGHEVTGTIEELGKDVKGFEVGGKVAIYCIDYCGRCYYCKKGLTNYCVEYDKHIMSDHWDGGLADYIRVPAKLLLKLPEDIDLKLGNLSLDTLGCPYGALREIEITRGNSIAVYGCGPIGLSFIKILNMRGINTDFAIDIADNKLKLAKEFGAKVTINALESNPIEVIKSMTDNLGVDMAFDASNSIEAFKNALYSVKKGGTIYVWAEHATFSFDVSDILIHRHLTLRGVMYFPIGEHDKIIGILRKGKESFEKLITHVYPLERVDEAYRTFFEDPTSIRVLVKP